MSDLDAAFDSLLPPHKRSGDRERDLADAVREARRRQEGGNIRDGGAVIRALHDEYEWTYRTVDEQTGLPYNTAQRWAAAAEE